MAVLADERRDDMHSERLEQLGLRNFIAGVPFNVRTNQPKSQFKQQIDQILQVANIQPAHFYSAGQVHGDTVQYADGVTGEAYTTGRFFPDTDGLITDKTGIALLIKYADWSRNSRCRPPWPYSSETHHSRLVDSLNSGRCPNSEPMNTSCLPGKLHMNE